MKFLRLLLLFGLFGFGYAQEFGLNFSFPFHQYRTQVAQYPPRLGIGVRGIAKFDLTGKSTWKLMPEFGYFLSNSKTVLDSSEYLSVLSGMPVGVPVNVNIWTHFLDFRLLVKYHFDASEGFGVYVAPQVLSLLGQTLITSYEIVNPGGESQKIQEWQQNPLDQVRKVIPRFVVNGLLGAEVRMLPKSAHKWFLSGGIILQGDRYLLPSGGEIGMKVYFGANR